MAANTGKEKARFPFTHKHGLITKIGTGGKACAVLQDAQGKDLEMSSKTICMSVNCPL